MFHSVAATLLYSNLFWRENTERLSLVLTLETAFQPNNDCLQPRWLGGGGGDGTGEGTRRQGRREREKAEGKGCRDTGIGELLWWKRMGRKAEGSVMKEKGRFCWENCLSKSVVMKEGRVKGRPE